MNKEEEEEEISMDTKAPESFLVSFDIASFFLKWFVDKVVRILTRG